jgi:hypothetical protein
MGSSELNVALAIPAPVKTSQGEIGVLPLKLGQLQAASKALRPLLDAFEAGLSWPAIFENHTGEVVTLMALCTGQSEETLHELELAEALDVAAAVIEANADFFVRRVRPILSRLLTRLLGNTGNPAETPETAEPAGAASSNA